MGLSDLDIRPSYETLGDCDPVSEFYIPALAESMEYDRSVGFFSSASLALAARGIAGLIKNEGRMRLVVSPHFSEADLKAIQDAGKDRDDAVEEAMSAAMMDVETLADEIERDHVRALGWMLRSGYLDLRIACVVDGDGNIKGDQLFHQKVGILRDADGMAVSFSGSINETASGWLYNSEEFKVFKNWESGQMTFFQSDEQKFEEIWNNRRSLVRVFEPRGAFCEYLVNEGKSFDIEYNSLDRYGAQSKANRVSLFPYQEEAVQRWRDCDGRLLFEMATGTGKTRTALACLNEVLQKERRVVCVIATPQSTLSRQWERELRALSIRFDSTIFADSSTGTSTEWARELQENISRILIGRSNSLIVFTTHASACSSKLVGEIESLPSSVSTCLIADEVHGLGAAKQKQALSGRYDYRIGLSATPSRWFDESGTSLIRSFFGDSFVFSIRSAQNTINPLTGKPFLCPYRYHLIFTSLTDEESEKYCALSRRIAQLSHSDDPDNQERLEKLLLERARVKKDAENKLLAFRHLIDSENLAGGIVFTSPKHICEVESMLGRCGIAAHRYTSKQGTVRKAEFGGLSEREYILKLFRQGDYEMLIAMKCLDEGIDIPEARVAVLLSSSTNPREYVQRIGRVIRQSPGKEVADIYDFVVEPDWSRLREVGDLQEEKRLFEQEMRRVEDMRINALNSTEVLITIRERLGRAYGDQ